MLSGHPHIFTYISYVIIAYIICFPGHPDMFTCIYIYTILSGHPHIHIYIYFKPHNPSTQPSQQQQPAAAAAAAAAAAGCCYTFEEMEEMQASANVPIRDIHQVYHVNGIYIQDWW